MMLTIYILGNCRRKYFLVLNFEEKALQLFYFEVRLHSLKKPIPLLFKLH
jgi:hypothetical protein